MKVYLGGPMRGYDAFNFPAFFQAEKELTADGHDVISPATHDVETYPEFDYRSNSLDGFDLSTSILWDLEQVANVDAVVFLSGWEKSSGCKVERNLAHLLGKPVFYYANHTLTLESVGDARFHALLHEIGTLHDRKQQDYGSDHDAFANVRAAEEFGVQPWIGALMRMNDKMVRLQHFAQKGSLANESAEDSFMDIAVYALIALVLYREASE